MYTKIVNPKTGKKINIYSKQGITLLNKYLKLFGGSDSNKNLWDKLPWTGKSNIKHQLKIDNSIDKIQMFKFANNDEINSLNYKKISELHRNDNNNNIILYKINNETWNIHDLDKEKYIERYGEYDNGIELISDLELSKWIKPKSGIGFNNLITSVSNNKILIEYMGKTKPQKIIEKIVGNYTKIEINEDVNYFKQKIFNIYGK